MKGPSAVWVWTMVVSRGSPAPPPMARASSSLGFHTPTWMPGSPR